MNDPSWIFVSDSDLCWPHPQTLMCRVHFLRGVDIAFSANGRWAVSDRTTTRDEIAGFRRWRDEGRKGWFVTESAQRFIVVKGVIQGQPCLHMTSAEQGRMWVERMADRYVGNYKRSPYTNEHVWAVLSLEQLDLDLAEPEPRSPIESYLGYPQGYPQADPSPMFRVDPSRRYHWGQSLAYTKIPNASLPPLQQLPRGLSDAEILAAYEQFQRADDPTVLIVRLDQSRFVPAERFLRIKHDLISLPYARQLWTNAVNARCRAQAQAERARVLGPIDDPDEA